MIMNYETRPCVEDDEEFIEEKLDTIDYSIVPPEEGTENENLVFRITDNRENLIAGCIVEISSWKLANLDFLWVEEKYRKKGLGSALIREAEKAARDRDCYAMILGTFDFQARPLYERHGYSLCGIIRDFPKGHENYAMMKRLDRHVQEYVPSQDLSAGFEIKSGDEEDAEIIGKEVGDIPAVLHFRPFPVDETVRPAQIGCKVNERLVELEILRAMVVCPIYPG